MRIEDLRIDTVLILLPQPLFGTTCTGTVVADSLDIVLIVGAPCPRDLKGRRMWPAVLDDESVVAISEFDSSRRSITPLSRHTQSASSAGRSLTVKRIERSLLERFSWPCHWSGGTKKQSRSCHSRTVPLIVVAPCPLTT